MGKPTGLLYRRGGVGSKLCRMDYLYLWSFLQYSTGTTSGVGRHLMNRHVGRKP